MTSTPNTRSRRLSNSSQQVCFNERPQQICLCHHPAGCFCLCSQRLSVPKWKKELQPTWNTFSNSKIHNSSLFWHWKSGGADKKSPCVIHYHRMQASSLFGRILMREKMFLSSLTWRYDFALIKGDGYNEAMYDEEDASTISLLLTSNFILLVFFSTYISKFKWFL